MRIGFRIKSVIVKLIENIHDIMINRLTQCLHIIEYIPRQHPMILLIYGFLKGNHQ